MPDVRLTVNGLEYRGWTDVRVTRGIEFIAGSFALSVSERWGGQDVAWPILEGDECTLTIDEEVLITGYVDLRQLSYDADAHRLSVSGRDKAGDLVDCSAVLKQWEFHSLPLLDVCQRLAEPFGITVTLQAGLDDRAVSTTGKTKSGGSPTGVGSAGKSSSMTLSQPNARLTINPGDSPYEVIDRACRLVGVLPVSDGQGGIVLTRAGSGEAATSLVEGENILSAEATYDANRRYRRYIVSGQSGGSDSLFGEAAAAVKAEASDLGARAARVLLVRPDGAVTTAFAKQRAAWESTVRAARSASIAAIVQGWTQRDGSLWPINARVKVLSPRLGVDAELLITEATYALSLNGGTTTDLKLVRPDAFVPEPVIMANEGGGLSGLAKLGL